jgi:hypothetical protein
MITILENGSNEETLAKTCISQRKGPANPEILEKIIGWQDEKTDYCLIKQKDLYK